MEALSFQEPPVPVVMLSELGPARPIGIDSHGHIEFEWAHDHSHTKPKKRRGDGDYRHLTKHHGFMQLESLVGECAFIFKLGL